MDAITSAYLASLSRQPILSAKEINEVLDLAPRYPESKKLAELAGRAETGRQELGRLHTYVNDSWFHRSLLSATVQTEEELRRISEMDVSQLFDDDPIGRKFHQRVTAWFTGGKQPNRQEAAAPLTGKRKQGDDSTDVAEAEDDMMTADEVSDEAALASFLCTLRQEETDYRNYMRDVVMSQANSEAAHTLAALFPAPRRGTAIEVSGIHVNVPKEAILAMAELAAFTRNLPIDLTALAANLQSGDSRSFREGNLCSHLFPLEKICAFEHGASPFGVGDIHPQAFLITDTKPNVKGEGYATPVYPCLVVVSVDNSHTVLEAALIRGIRWEEGAYENSVALASADALSRLRPIADDIPFEVHFHIGTLFRFKSTGPRQRPYGGRGGGGQSSSNQPSTIQGAKEIVLRIDISYGGFNVDEVQLITEVRQALGVMPGGTASRLAERGGSQFTYCLSFTDGFQDNFHMSHLAPSPNITSIVPGIDEGQNILRILKELERTFYHLHDIEGLYLARGFSHDNTGKLKIGVQALDKLYIVWKGSNYMGTFDTSTMDALVSSMSPRQHLRQEKDVGRAHLNALNNIMILLHTDSSGRVSNLKFEALPAPPTPIRSIASFGVRREPGQHAIVRSPASPPVQAAVLNTRDSYREMDRFEMGGGGPGTPTISSFSPAAITHLGSGERTEYPAPAWRGVASPAGGQTSTELVDMSAINRIIKVQVEKELAPLRKANDALQKKVDNLEFGIASIGTEMVGVKEGLKAATEVWRKPEFGEFFQGLLVKANAAGRADASGVAAPAQDLRQGTNPNAF